MPSALNLPAGVAHESLIFKYDSFAAVLPEFDIVWLLPADVEFRVFKFPALPLNDSVPVNDVVPPLVKLSVCGGLLKVMSWNELSPDTINVPVPVPEN